MNAEPRYRHCKPRPGSRRPPPCVYWHCCGVDGCKADAPYGFNHFRVSRGRWNDGKWVGLEPKESKPVYYCREHRHLGDTA